MTHITLADVTVRYPVFTTLRQRSLLSFAANRASFGRVAREVGSIPVVEALNGVSFDLKEGDRLALVGRNGAGKTSLLKVCAGLIMPDSGKVRIEGSRAAVFQGGGGFDSEKTGLENIEMVGRLHGLSRSRRKLLIEDVADFTELGDFLSLPTRTYSAGMLIRLTFALATSVERDILIVDEVISAGDAHFVGKAAKRVQDMFKKAKIFVFATHSGHFASQLCNRAAWIDGGRAVMTGPPMEVWTAYIEQRPTAVETAA